MSALGDLIQQYLDTHPSARKKDIAAAAGVSAQTISGWLSGTKIPNPKPESMVGLASALGVSAREVMLRVSTDRGVPVHEVGESDLPPNVRVLIATASGLRDEENIRMVTQLVTSLAEQEDKKRPRRRKGR